MSTDSTHRVIGSQNWKEKMLSMSKGTEKSEEGWEAMNDLGNDL